MCLKFFCCGGDDADDGSPASKPVVKPPSSLQPVQMPPPSGQLLPSSAMNGLPTPSSATNGVKTPEAAGDNKSSPQEPGKFDTAKKEADKQSEKVKQEAKAKIPDYPISSTTADYKPSSSPIKEAHKKDDSAKNGGQDADVDTSRMNQDDHRLRRPSVDVVGSQANRGTINQDHERRASTNEPTSEAVDSRIPRADDIGLPANPIPGKDQPRRGGHIY